MSETNTLDRSSIVMSRETILNLDRTLASKEDEIGDITFWISRSRIMQRCLGFVFQYVRKQYLVIARVVLPHVHKQPYFILCVIY